MIMYAVLRAVLLIVVLPSRGGVTQDAKVMIFQKKKEKNWQQLVEVSGGSVSVATPTGKCPPRAK